MLGPAHAREAGQSAAQLVSMKHPEVGKPVEAVTSRALRGPEYGPLASVRALNYGPLF